MTQPPTSTRASARRLWLEGGLVVAFWVLILLLNVGRRAIDPHGPNSVTPTALLEASLEYLLWCVLTPGIFWLARRFGPESKNRLRAIALHVTIALAAAFVMDAFGHFSYDRLMRDESRFDLAEFGRHLLVLRFLDELIIYLVVLAAGFARDYFLRYRERQEQAAQLEADKAKLQAQLTEARLQTLRMQINPHFLFNTLHAVSSLVERDPRGVRRMIARLSDLLRYTLEHSNTQEIPLQQELDVLHQYLEIQKIRFQDQLDVTEDIAPETLDALVPNLILQPLVENAIKHGISQLETAGHITVKARRDGDHLRLSVHDNGPGIEGDGAPDLERGVGLRNTKARLEGLYGDAYQLGFDATGLDGLTVEISLPFHTRADLLTHAVPS
jgi:signal transduction histidine kinase